MGKCKGKGKKQQNIQGKPCKLINRLGGRMLETNKEALIDSPVIVNNGDDANVLSVSSVAPYNQLADAVDPANTKDIEGEVKEVALSATTPEDVVDGIEEITEPEEVIAAKEDVAVEPAKEEVKADKVPKAVQERIDKAIKKQRVAERERDLEAQRVKELEDKVAELESRVPVEGKPDPEDYETEAEYIEALTDWKVDKALKDKLGKSEKAKEVDTKKIEAVNSESELQDKLIKASSDARKKYKDFDEIFNIDTPRISNDMLPIIANLETPHDVMHYLGKNPDISSSIADMDATRAAIALAKIDAKLNTPAPKRVTSAPEPIVPVKTTGLTEKPLHDLPFKEYVAARQQGRIT